MSDFERIDILDGEGRITGTMSRAQAERDNHTTQNVLVFVFDSTGRVWIQKRPFSKKHYPGLWDISACGGIVSGEEPIAAASREQFEEMGFSCPLKHVETFLNVFPAEDGSPRSRLSHLFVGRSDLVPEANDEVDEFIALNTEELVRLVGSRPQEYVPSFAIELAKAIAGLAGS
jgi:isopentenyl-diphosphate delta-isomerase